MPDQKTNAAPTGLAGEVEEVLGQLHRALSETLQQLRPPVKRASQLQRLLDLDRSLSWSVFSAARAERVFSLASLLPGRRALERYFAAAGVHGVSASELDQARAAFARFEELVQRRAGSREAFATMVNELAPAEGRDDAAGGAGADLKRKRAAFHANSLLWGRQARVFYAARVMHPSAAPGRERFLDTLFVKGVVGLHRTRRAAPLYAVSIRRWTTGPGDPAHSGVAEPVDPRESGPDAVRLLRDFCSQPLPEFRPLVTSDGNRIHEVVAGEIGLSGEVTYFTGEVFRADSAVPRPGSGAEIDLAKSVDIPLEQYVGDIFVHQTVRDTRPPEVEVYACPVESAPVGCVNRLPLTESAEYLGKGLYAARLPSVPRHAEMLSYALQRVGWKEDEFHVFRCQVEYPVLYSGIRMRLR